MGDIEDRRELSNKELSDLEYRKFKDQDKQFEVLHDVIRVNKYNAEEISHEADQHLQILDGLDENVDLLSILLYIYIYIYIYRLMVFLVS